MVIQEECARLEQNHDTNSHDVLMQRRTYIYGAEDALMSHVQPPTGAVAFRNLVRSLSIHLRWTPLCRGCRWTMGALQNIREHSFHAPAAVQSMSCKHAVQSCGSTFAFH